MVKIISKEVLQKIRNGDGLTDDELRDSAAFYSDLKKRIQALGPEFHLAWKEINTVSNRLNGYVTERKRQNT